MMRGRIIVVGAINTDLVIRATHLPAPGETVVGDGLQTFGGGKGANAAVAAARAGAQVTLIGAVGDDSAGADALAALRQDGVDIGGVAVLPGIATGAALIVVDPQGQNQIALGPGANGAVSPAHVRNALDERLGAVDVVLVSTEIPIAAVAEAVATAARAGVRCVLNPAPVIDGLAELLIHAPVLTPNQIELAELASRSGSTHTECSDDTIADSLHALSARSGAPVIVTLGAAGCAAVMPDGTLERILAPQVTSVVDTTGAGDTFNGVLATRLAFGDTLTQAMHTAVLAASMSIAAVGARAGMPHADAIARLAFEQGAKRP
jgi:ribokinase